MSHLVQLALEVGGALLILAAFALNQFRGLDRHGFVYLSLNLAGAAILAVLAGKDRQWGFFLLQVAWALVAARGLLSLVRRGEAAT